MQATSGNGLRTHNGIRKNLSPAYWFRLFVWFFASTAVGLYLAFSPRLNYQFFNHDVLFRPERCESLDSSVTGRKGSEVSFKNRRGDLLSGVYFGKPAQNARTILIHHGMAGNLNTHNTGYEVLSERLDAAVLAYDYSGFGKSAGEPTVQDLADDGLAAYEFLVHEKQTDPSSIIHYAGSLGTGPAIAVASEHPCAGLVLVAPYCSIKSAARDALPYLRLYPDMLIVEKDLESLDNIRKITRPVLIVHGKNDRTIPVKHGEVIFAAANEPKRFIKVENGDHFRFGPTVKAEIDEFMRSL